MSDFDVASLSCPLPIEQYPHVLLAHGGGGRLMQQLINQVFLPAFGGAEQVQHDAATLSLGGDRIALTTDSYVVHPLFFPGGDIGSMAVYGTVNDLAMAGGPASISHGGIHFRGRPADVDSLASGAIDGGGGEDGGGSDCDGRYEGCRSR